MAPFTQAIATELQLWLNRNEKEVKAIADKALQARKAREAARKAREAVREQVKKKEKALKFDRTNPLTYLNYGIFCIKNNQKETNYN